MQAVILAIDSRRTSLSLGIKQLQPDAWESYFQQHHVNDMVHGRVCRLAGFGGAFVELAEGVEGLCHFSEVPGWTGRSSADRRSRSGTGIGFQDYQDERSREKDRAQPEGLGG